MTALSLTPAIAIHTCAALAATAIGPVVLWARSGPKTFPRLHRALGYAWTTLMVAAAVSALFIQGSQGPRWAGFGLLHLLVPVTLASLFLAFRHLVRGNIAGHRQTMRGLYLGACVVAGAFTLLPGRLLGHGLRTLVGGG